MHTPTKVIHYIRMILQTRIIPLLSKHYILVDDFTIATNNSFKTPNFSYMDHDPFMSTRKTSY